MISEDCEMTRLTFTGTTQSEFSSYSASLNTFIKANLQYKGHFLAIFFFGERRRAMRKNHAQVMYELCAREERSSLA